jgi:hypothetical protein
MNTGLQAIRSGDKQLLKCISRSTGLVPDSRKLIEFGANEIENASRSETSSRPVNV